MVIFATRRAKHFISFLNESLGFWRRQSNLQEGPNSSHIFMRTEDQHLCKSDAPVLPVPENKENGMLAFKRQHA